MNKKLAKYQAKRNFNKTTEPTGKKVKKLSTKKKIFSVQYHVARRPHYDFRLQWEDVLVSFAIPKGLSFNPKDKRLAVHVEDHPLDYAYFEGSIPKGEYGGGTVMLWDEGEWIIEGDFKKSFEAGTLKFTLNGQRLKGKWTLIRLKEESNQDNWLLIKEKDAYIKKTSGIARFKQSIKSNLTIEEIAKKDSRKNPFTNFDIQLAKLVEELPKDDSNWLYEVKYDGYRILAIIENNNVKLITRNHLDITDKFNEIANSLKILSQGKSMILDGEIVIFDKNGKSSFQELQNYIKKKNNESLSYMIFDLLSYDGIDLRETPLIERKKKLETILSNPPIGIHYCQHILNKGKQFYKEAKKLDLEGIIGKKIDSTYTGGRNGDWIKLKFRKGQEFIIGGYLVSEKREIQSLLLGVLKSKKLQYVGKVGTGLSTSNIAELKSKFASLERKTSPFNEKLPIKSDDIKWLSPKLIAEVEFTEFTKDNLLRQASFKGLRIDKTTKEVKIEKDDSLKITNPQRIIYKNLNITKQDVINYYKDISSYMLPYLNQRIVSVIRCHNGIQKSCFFKKHPTQEHEGIVVQEIKNSKGENENYFYIENENGLIYEVQLGSLEFHIWGSQVHQLDSPNLMVFDLDPDEKMSLNQIRQGVKDLKSVLDQLSLKSFLKTSGGKGYHVVVPIQTKISWEQFKSIAKQIAIYMEEKWPDKYTSNMRKNQRKGKIFIDWVRNTKGATSVAPYSLRARPKASVSMPISYNELDKIAPDEITLFDAIKRVKKKNPWKDFFKTQNDLNKLKDFI